jgi:hypothetical protein
MPVDFIARVKSYGFQGHYWKPGDVATVSEDDLDNPCLIHFDRVIPPAEPPPPVTKKSAPKSPRKKRIVADDDFLTN